MELRIAPHPGDFVRYGDEAGEPGTLKGRLLRIDQYGQAIVYCTDNVERVLSYGRLTVIKRRPEHPHPSTSQT